MPIYTINSSEDYITLIDDLGANTFIGISLVGTPISSPLWKIKRISEVGSEIIISWADGSTDFNKTWNDRNTYDYSL